MHTNFNFNSSSFPLDFFCSNRIQIDDYIYKLIKLHSKLTTHLKLLMVSYHFFFFFWPKWFENINVVRRENVLFDKRVEEIKKYTEETKVDVLFGSILTLLFILEGKQCKVENFSTRTILFYLFELRFGWQFGLVEMGNVFASISNSFFFFF